MPWSAATVRANKVFCFVFPCCPWSESQATAGDLVASVPPTRVICDRNFSFSVKAASDLDDDERTQMWQMLEENMRELYISSSFGWDPRKKKRETFNPRSRFIVVRHVSDHANVGSGITAYSMFRFEREDRQNVVYCYELQVLEAFRRFGLGRLLVQMLSDIGVQWGMTKIMLTVFKANDTAMSFYKSTGFTTDEMSPDFSGDPEGETEECDYTILSRRLIP